MVQDTVRRSNTAREAQREYNRKWRQKNPDKVRKYAADYWERKAAQMQAGNEKKTQ